MRMTLWLAVLGLVACDAGGGTPDPLSTGEPDAAVSSIPDAAAGIPDARPGSSSADASRADAGPSGAADAAPSAADAGPGGTLERCPIEKSALKVAFPYVSDSPATVVTLGGYCYRQVNSATSEGYNYADVVNVFQEGGTSTLRVENVSGLLFYIAIKMQQRAPSASELSSIAGRTGIPVALIEDAGQTLTTDFYAQPKIEGYTLPQGVSFSVFVPTSAGEMAVFQ